MHQNVQVASHFTAILEVESTATKEVTYKNYLYVFNVFYAATYNNTKLSRKENE